VLTDLALLEIATGRSSCANTPGRHPDEIRRKTAGRLIVPDDVCEMRFN
jgi:3-oxoacid CoA-transferase subunit B